MGVFHPAILNTTRIVEEAGFGPGERDACLAIV